MKRIRGKKKETTIDNLAVMVAKGFNEVNIKIGGLDGRMGNLENKMGNLEDNLSATRRDVLEIGDRFVPRYEFHDLLIRFDKLEQKVKGK